MSVPEPCDVSDQRCPVCGYNVRGLPSLTCPECGIEFSIDELRNKHRKRSFNMMTLYIIPPYIISILVIVSCIVNMNTVEVSPFVIYVIWTAFGLPMPLIGIAVVYIWRLKDGSAQMALVSSFVAGVIATVVALKASGPP